MRSVPRGSPVASPRARRASSSVSMIRRACGRNAWPASVSAEGDLWGLARRLRASLSDALDHLGLPWRWSSHAGGFLCNHVFYVARHALSQRVEALLQRDDAVRRVVDAIAVRRGAGALYWAAAK